MLAAAAVLLALGGGIVAAGTGVAGGGSARAATLSLCNSSTASVGGGSYIVQNNEFGSRAPECVTTDGKADFTVARSSIAAAANGAPGAYPSIYQGCHWGSCSSGGLASSPVQVSKLSDGAVTTSWSTVQPGGGSGAYDVAYDIWFSRAPNTSGQPDGTELMVWLNHRGPVQPVGAEVARNVSVGGRSYNLWRGAASGTSTVTYDLASGVTSVSGLDVGQLARDAVSRGYAQQNWYLTGIEAGFELWRGGAGLATSSFSVSENRGLLCQLVPGLCLPGVPLHAAGLRRRPAQDRRSSR